MLEGMTGPQFNEWMAYAELEPFGEQRADLRMAILASLIANVHRDPKKSKPFTPAMFMPDFEKAWDERTEQVVVPEHERVWQRIKSVFGKRVRPPLASSSASSPDGDARPSSPHQMNTDPGEDGTGIP